VTVDSQSIAALSVILTVHPTGNTLLIVPLNHFLPPCQAYLLGSVHSSTAAFIRGRDDTTF
jgi:hypothetical protein